uniref:Uncharacterized protein n=1 Tax=Arundo donax TaxID=35708 RepID=A0A0A8Z3D1_ARUDO
MIRKYPTMRFLRSLTRPYNTMELYIVG